MKVDCMELPAAETNRIRVGHMRLSDSAPLLLARHHGLFEQYGLDVELVCDVSWANLRDKLVAGELDAAQMLSPLVAMSGLYPGGIPGHLLTGLVLSRNGNAITVSTAIAKAMGAINPRDTMASASTLSTVASRLARPLVLAVVHPFSIHHLLLRRWLHSGGFDLQKDVQLLVLPPEQMCEYLSRGAIDGFCAGEPWTSVAVQRGTGVCAAVGYDIWQDPAEKVLAVTDAWHQSHRATHLRLRLAMMDACELLLDPEQRVAAAHILSQDLDLPEAVLLPGLSGQFRFNKQSAAQRIDDFFVFSSNSAGHTDASEARDLIDACADFSRVNAAADEMDAEAARCFRSDLYREAAAWRQG